MADEQIQELRVRNDQICEELGLPKFQKDEQKRSHGMSNAEYYTAVKGESWKFELMCVIDECMRYAASREDFLALLRAEGYGATWDGQPQKASPTPRRTAASAVTASSHDKIPKKKIWRQNLDTERRMTTQEMLTQHKKLMDEAQRLEPSVMVTERNWSALLEMQDRLFQQQMQLDTDLKMLLTKAAGDKISIDKNRPRKWTMGGAERKNYRVSQLELCQEQGGAEGTVKMHSLNSRIHF